MGNEEYARTNKSFGLTTMRDKHVDVSGSTVHFNFRGKSGKQHSVDVQDPRLARIVKKCQDIPGQELFQYLDEAGNRQTIGSADVNAYLKEITGRDFTAKDFRTWAGTVLAARALQELEPVRFAGQSEKEHCARGRSGLADAREHADDLPEMLRASRRPPSVPRRRVDQHVAHSG